MSSKPIRELKPIEPLQQRWEPSPNAADTHIPGLDTNAPINDQNDQIEHMKTLKLQNIDANIAQAHHLLLTRLLPTFKRFAVATEPVRDAAKSWTAFFEAAAQVNLPRDDFSYAEEPEEPFAEAEETAADQTIREAGPSDISKSVHPSPSVDPTHNTTFDPDRTPSESSFMPGSNAISSTPATTTRYRMENPQDSFSTDTSSHVTSSPMLAQLSRGLRAFSLDDEMPERPVFLPASTSVQHSQIEVPSTDSEDSILDDEPTPQAHILPSSRSPSPSRSRSRSKSKGRSRSLRENVLRTTASRRVSAAHNPYLPEGTDPKNWSGVVDLRDISVIRSPARGRAPPPPQSDEGEDEDDMSFVANLRKKYGGGSQVSSSFGSSMEMPAPRSTTIARSPAKAAASRIGRDLLEQAAGRAYGHEETTSSTYSSLPTPPRWQEQPQESGMSSSINSTLENLMRRVQNAANDPSSAPPEDVDSSFDDSFEVDDNHTSMNPSAAFILASGSASSQLDDSGDSEDSFDGGDGGNTSDIMAGGGGAVHPFAGGFVDGGFGDDSFEDGDLDGETEPVEETVFGMAPAQRAARASEGGNGRLRIYGGDFEDDTISRLPDQSPTPYAGDNSDLAGR
ncbi:hypothetical protein PENSPDRAFT_666824 [Peniophora sp. CONT]|nr:hypothetical protein PENSPDRAFT_666824 [Peniophora sp. CONT]